MEKWAGDISEKTTEVKLCHLKDFFDRKKNPLNNRGTTNKVFNGIGDSLIGQKKFIKKLREKMILSGLGIRKTDNFASPDCFVVSGPRFSGKSYFVELLEDSLEKNSVNVLSYSGVHFSDSYSAHKIASSDGHNTSICEKVLISPNSVIIIDDFHKVSPVSIPLFNQIFKHGQLQMSNGDIADFSNAKIFVTSSVIKDKSMGFNSSAEDPTPAIFEEISDLFDCNIFLKKLSSKDILKILSNKLTEIKTDLKLNGVNLAYSNKFLQKFVKDTNGLVDFEKRFDSQINKFICSQITSNRKNINLDKIKKNA